MSTHVPGLQSFSRFIAFMHHLILAKFATSGIRVNGSVRQIISTVE